MIVHVQIGNEDIQTTFNHPFYVVGKGFVRAGKLEAGDEILTSEGQKISIEKIEIEVLAEPVYVYNFTVEDFHTYFVSELGVWVHNACLKKKGGSNNGYNPKPGERTLNGYVKNNANSEVALYTKSTGFNNGNGNAGGQFKRLGANEHYGLSPHVHQPVRNITIDGTIYGKTGKTVGVDVLSPSKKDVKQLYEYLNNGKYHK